LLALAACSQTEPPAQYSIEQFYNNTRITGGAFLEDESKLLVNSDESGIFNVFEIDVQEIYMDGKRRHNLIVYHRDIMNGSTLEIVRGPSPATGFTGQVE